MIAPDRTYGKTGTFDIFKHISRRFPKHPSDRRQMLCACCYVMRGIQAIAGGAADILKIWRWVGPKASFHRQRPRVVAISCECVEPNVSSAEEPFAHYLTLFFRSIFAFALNNLQLLNFAAAMGAEKAPSPSLNRRSMAKQEACDPCCHSDFDSWQVARELLKIPLGTSQVQLFSCWLLVRCGPISGFISATLGARTAFA